MGLQEILARSGKLCKIQGCWQHRRVRPCESYGTCRLPIFSEKGEDCFICGAVALKLEEFCYYHTKFGANGNGNDKEC